MIFVEDGQKNTTLNFNGKETNLTAHKDGYLVNVSDVHSSTGWFSPPISTPSTVVFNAKEGRMEGLVTIDTLKQGQKKFKKSW